MPHGFRTAVGLFSTQRDRYRAVAQRYCSKAEAFLGLSFAMGAMSGKLH
jgi:hypothetical protein